MNEDFILGFDIDLGTLIPALDKLNTTIDQSFDTTKLTQFESNVKAIGQTVELLKGKFSGLSTTQQKMVESAVAGTGRINRAAREVIGSLQEEQAAVESLITAYGKFPTLQRLRDTGLTPGALGGLRSVYANDNPLGINGQSGNRNVGSWTSPALNNVKEFNEVLGINKTKLDASRTAFAQLLRDEEKADVATQKAADEMAQAWQSASNEAMYAMDRFAKKAQTDADEIAAAFQIAASKSDEYFEAMQARQAMINKNSLPVVGRADAFKLDESMGARGPQTIYNAFEGLDTEVPKKVQRLSSVFDGFWGHQAGLVTSHVMRWMAFTAAIGATVGVVQKLAEELEKGLSKASEFQVQGILFQTYQRAAGDAGRNPVAAGNGQLFADAAKLAAVYGDNINDVIQDLSLWYKETGSLNGALAITNEAMKFQIASGTDLEDIYRTLTALTHQLGGTRMGPDDKSKFDLSKTHEILNMIFAAASAAGAGLRQVGEGGKELGGTSNAAEILLHSLEQDGAALGKMNLSMKEIIALNQSLITAMGNTGPAADQAAERMSRLVGGIMELSKPSNATKLAQALGLDAFKQVQKALNGKNPLSDYIKIYEGLNTQQKNSLDLTFAGNRQYEIMATLLKQMHGSYTEILKAENDKSILDNTASQMMDTFKTKTHQLATEWQLVTQVIATGLIPLLSQAAVLAARILPGLLRHFSDKSDVLPIISGQKDYKGYLNSFENAKDPNAAIDAFGAMLEARAKQHKVSLPPDINRYLTSWGNLTGEQQWETVRKLASIKYGSGSILDKLGLGELGGTSAGTTGSLDMINSYPGGASAYFKNALSQALNLDSLKGKGGQGDGDAGPSVPDPKETGKVRTAADQQKTALDILSDAFKNYDNTRREAATANAADISLIEHQANVYGLTTDSISKLNAAYGHQNTILDNTNRGLEGYAKQFREAKKAAEDHRAHVAQSSPEYQKYTESILKADAALREISRAEQNNTDRIRENILAVIEKQNTLAKKNLDSDLALDQKAVSNAEKAFGKGQGSLGDVIAAYSQEISKANENIKKFVPGTDAFNDAMQAQKDRVDAAKEAISQYYKELHDGLNKAIVDTNDNIAGLAKSLPGYDERPGDAEYLKGMADLAKTVNEQQKTYAEYKAKIGADDAYKGELDQLAALYTQYDDLDRKVIEYKQHVDNIKASPLFQASETVMKDLGNDVSQDVIDGMFGNNAIRTKIANIDAQITAVEQLKQTEEMAYNASKYHSAAQKAEHEARLARYDAEIRKLQEKARAEQNALAHPNMLKKLGEDFTKTMIDSFMKQASQGALATFFKIKPDPALQQAFDHFHQTLSTKFDPSVKDFTEDINGQTGFWHGTEAFGKYVQQFNNAVRQLNSMNNSSSSSNSTGQNNFNAVANIINASSTSNNVNGADGSITSSSSGSSSAASIVLAGAGMASIFKPSGQYSPATQQALMGNQDLPGVYGAGQALPQWQMDAIQSNIDQGGSSGNYGGIFGNVKKGGGTWSQSGSLGKYAGMAGEAYGAYQGYKQGGLSGGLETGLSVFEMTGNPWLALAAAAVSAIFGGPKTSPDKNPDIYYSQEMGQGLANVGGSGYGAPAYSTVGTPYNEDPGLASSLGGVGEGQYIKNFINQNPTEAAKLLSPEQLKLFGGGGTFTETYGQNGWLTLDNGQQVQWKDLIDQAQQATQAIQNFKDALNQGGAAIMAFNQFGSGTGFYPYGWDIPGNNQPPPPNTGGGTTSGGSGNGSGKGSGSGSGDGSGDGKGSGSPGTRGNNPREQAAYSYRPSASAASMPQPVTTTVNVQLDGRTVAQSTQSYVLQTNRRGFNNI